MEPTYAYRAALSRRGLFLLIAVPLIGWGQMAQPHAPSAHHAASADFSVSSHEGENTSGNDLGNCGVRRVTSLPGSGEFASDFIEAIASDPDPRAKDFDVIWALTSDLAEDVPFAERAMYISKSTDGGATWAEAARLDSRYFDAEIGEGLRNGLKVSPGGRSFVITTQLGAFEVVPRRGSSEALVKAIAGPRVPASRPAVQIAKKSGDPVRANAVEMTADGKHLIVGYGYFDLEPQILSYHRGKDGSWIKDGPLPRFPTDMDILSMQFDDSGRANPRYLYVGTGDQAYVLDLRARKWGRIDGVEPDSAIHGMSMVGGLHLAACWAIYLPVSPRTVRRVTDARFIFHRGTDEAGANIRAYSIDVDRSKPKREVVTSLTGVYVSDDSGESWRRLSGLPEEEFRTSHFNSDGSVLVSGIAGTFLVNPFSDACLPRLKVRDK